MKKVCAWCKADLGDIPSSIHPPDMITHGICPTCRDRLAHETGETLRDFLDRLEVPVLLVEREARVLGANSQAQALLGKKMPEIENRLSGNVIECVHAHEPGGCGGTIHCKSCTIRKTVRDTYSSGEPHVNVPAYQDIRTPAAVKQFRFLISTEKVGDYVMLRIDDLQDGKKNA